MVQSAFLPSPSETVLGVRLAVDEHAAGLAEIEFQRAAKAGIRAERSAHLRDDFFHDVRSH